MATGASALGDQDKTRKAKRSKTKTENGKGDKVDQDGGGKPNQGESSNVTWARRRRPTNEAGALKWDTLKAVFATDIRPSLTYASVHEDPLLCLKLFSGVVHIS